MLNLLDLLARHNITPKKVASLHGGEYHSACPACGGKDRFHCWPERQSTNAAGLVGVWGCRQCDAAGDILSFLIRYDGMSFKDACALLKIDAKKSEYAPAILHQKQSKPVFAPSKADLPPVLWQEKNTKLVDHAHKTLLETPEQLAWLSSRGLDTEAISRYSLGWLAGERGESWYTRPLAAWGLPPDGQKTLFRFPRGLVIPRIAESGTVIAMRIRRLDADREVFAPATKYMAFRGAKAVPLLILPAGATIEQTTLVVVESELDAMLIAETARKAGLPIGALAVLSNTGRPDPSAHRACTAAARLLIAMDFDKAGEKGLPFWLETYPRAKDWPVPVGKDAGEAYSLGLDLRVWLEAGLPEAHRSRLLPLSGSQNEQANAVATTTGSDKTKKFLGAEQGGGAQVAVSNNAAASQASIPADVLHVHGLMQRYEFLYLIVGQGTFGIRIPNRWRYENWELSRQITDACLSSGLHRWLDTHPVQDGIIDRHNLLAR